MLSTPYRRVLTFCSRTSDITNIPAQAHVPGIKLHLIPVIPPCDGCLLTHIYVTFFWCGSLLPWAFRAYTATQRQLLVPDGFLGLPSFLTIFSHSV